jgi:hypothetical protein
MAAFTARRYHAGGVNELVGDGPVRFVKSTIAGMVWRVGNHRRRRGCLG